MKQRTTRPSASIQGLLVKRLLSVVAALLLVQAGLYYREFQKDRATSLQSSLEVSRGVAQLFASFVQDVRHDELVAGHALVYLRPFTRQQADDYLRQALGGRAEVRSALWADPQGRVQASSPSAPAGPSVLHTPGFREILAGKDWLITNLTRTPAPGTSTFSILQSIRDPSGRLLGVLVTSLDPDRMRPWLAVKRGPTGAIDVVDSSGWLVYRDPWPARIAYQERDWTVYPNIREALAGEESSGEVFAAYSRESRYASTVPIPGIGWAAGGGFARAAVVAPLLHDVFRDLALLVVVALLAVGLALHTAGGITASLHRLGQHAQEVGLGHLGHRAQVAGPGELAALATAFNRMADEVQAREAQQARILELERERARQAQQIAQLAETMNREIAHRVKNNLAMVSGLLQLQIAQQPEARIASALREAMTRLLTFASINEELQAAEGESLDLLDTVRRVVEAARGVFAAKAVSVSVEGDAISCPSRAVTDLSIVANELITNAIKHGQPGADGQLRIEIRVLRTDGWLALSVWNSGPPVPPGFDPHASPGLGLRLACSLAEDRYRGSFTLRPERDGNLAELVVPEDQLTETVPPSP